MILGAINVDYLGEACEKQAVLRLVLHSWILIFSSEYILSYPVMLHYVMSVYRGSF